MTGFRLAIRHSAILALQVFLVVVATFGFLALLGTAKGQTGPAGSVVGGVDAARLAELRDAL